MTPVPAPATPDTPRLPAHLYIHVPFCASRCDYCDFYSIASPQAEEVDRVFAAIAREIESWAVAGLGGRLETVYFGGGTPSLVFGHVARTLRFVRERIDVSPAAEITVEANPDSLTPEALATLADAGATRVSLGVQSLDDRVLATLGRRHTAQQALDAEQRVAEAGLALSVDLILGVPGESEQALLDTLAEVCESGARHVSAYPLSVEVGTPLSARIDRGALTEPDSDEQAEAMIATARALEGYGFERYEVANYAASPSDRSRHNTAYWIGAPYIGVGPAAHGMLDAATARAMGFAAPDAPAEKSRIRYGNAAGIDAWLRSTRNMELLSHEEALREDVMLGLRLAQGVTAGLVAQAGLGAVIESLAADGLVERHTDRWRTTERGWLLGNEVFARVWNAEE